VRGRAGQSIQNHLKHAFGIRQHIIVPETQKVVPHDLQLPCSMCVVRHLLEMLTAIQLHDQLRIYACEVDDVTADFMLSAEFESMQLSIAEIAPQLLLRIRHSCAQLARSIYIAAFHP
jgi:hypothetical protein